MTTGFPLALRQRLGRMRLAPDGTVASRGIGERRSRAKGDGLEFEDYRPYQAGDDMRRIDPRVYARTGDPYVRRYNVGQQLPVTILCDQSRSMAYGHPSKAGYAAALCDGLSFVALAGSDVVRGAVHRDGGLVWSGWYSGAARGAELASWFDHGGPSGSTDLVGAVAAARAALPANGLTIVVSDFWDPEAQRALELLAAAKQVVVAVVVLSPQELRPDLGSAGEVRLVDMETGDEVAATIGPEQLARYDALLRARTDELRGRALALGGRFARVSTADPFERVFLRTFTAAGIVG